MGLVHASYSLHKWQAVKLTFLHPALQLRAQNNGRSMDNVRPDCGLDRSNPGLAGHFDWSFLDSNILT